MKNINNCIYNNEKETKKNLNSATRSNKVTAGQNDYKFANFAIESHCLRSINIENNIVNQ